MSGSRQRSKSKPKSQVSDLGTKELQSHMAVKIDVVEGKRRLRILTQTPLDFYLNREYISKPQYEAGHQLYRDFYFSGMQPSLVPVLGEVLGTSGGEKNLTAKQMEARDRWKKAIKSVRGEIGRSMIVNVCCYGYLLKDFSIGYYTHSAIMMPRFKEALDDLISYYNIPV